MTSPGANVPANIWHFNNCPLGFVIKVILSNQNLNQIYNQKHVLKTAILLSHDSC